jgi:4-hydroxybenzoate polyprenyltransferase
VTGAGPGVPCYNLPMALLRSIRTTLEMIKWEHSVFALPFALCGAMLAAGGWPAPRQVLWICVAMVAGRSAAMAFNRLVDARLDAANPRTRDRALPAGALTTRFVALFVVAACLVLVLAAAQLNRLTFALSPMAIAILFFYSFSKRFTRWSHLLLGFALGITPAAAWIAIRGALDPRILILTAAVTFWVAGFDVLYACQDYDFDLRTGLHSVPRWFGIPRALVIARWLHAVMVLLLAAFVHAFHLGYVADAGILVVAGLLAYEHSLVAPNDLGKLNAAFFTMNGVISILFLGFVAGDLLLHR